MVLMGSMAQQHGQAFADALLKGQMERQVGIAYWGKEAGWSNTVQREVAQEYLRSASRLFVLDLHTAVGEYGKWSVYGMEEDSAATFGQWIEASGTKKSMLPLEEAGVTSKPWPFYEYVMHVYESLHCCTTSKLYAPLH
jgi:hypothetical protein